MRTRPLGNTGLAVSEIALGTVELGMPYGFRGGSRYAQPDRPSAVRLLHRALELGINLFDTASAYGQSEAIIGEALRDMGTRPYIATKVSIPDDRNPAAIQAAMQDSIENSLRLLGIETIDVLQIHNATEDVLRSEEILRALEDAVRAGKVRTAGASVYRIEEALLAIEQPLIRTLQAPFNVLDQNMRERVFDRAAAHGIGMLVRSVFLRGVLTDDAADIPARLQPLRTAAEHARQAAQSAVSGITELALRFCLSVPGVASVLIGVRSVEELESNVAAAERGSLDPETTRHLYAYSLGDEPLLSPLNWNGLI